MSGDYVELRAFVDAWRDSDARDQEHSPSVDGRRYFGDSWFQVPGTDAKLTEPQLRAALDELEQLRGDCKALTEGNQRLQTMNDGLRQIAIEAREAAEGWHRATIDLYSGRAEPCPCGCRPEFTDCGCGMNCECAGRCPVCDVSAEEQQPAPEPKPPTRRNALLAAIQREGGDWSPLRARAALMSAGYDVASNLAAREMKILAASGFLEQVRPRAYTYRLKAEVQQPAPDGGD